MSFAFSFDASTCTGCKACQIACKDKNNLPTGVLWRRVFEVSGGTWKQQGAAWTNDVFAYNLSFSCGHCVHPKCAGVCPTNAYTQREDGIVILDETKCMGCGYCSWACPYSVPQRNPVTGTLGKCDLCHEALEAGLPPACVAACPLRSLDLVQVDEASQTTFHLWELPAAQHPFPLPDFSRTEPHLAIQPHPAMLNNLEKKVTPALAKPPRSLALEELPLLLFTLSGQAAAGLALFTLLLGPRWWNLLLIGLLLGLGGLFSFLHLGNKSNAWRALSNLRKSWLSREVLSSGLFGGAWFLSLAEWLFFHSRWLLIPTCALGLYMVHSMGNIYRLRTQPAWNSWRTNIGFFLSAAILGLAASIGQSQGLLLPILLALLIGVQLVVRGRYCWWERSLSALVLGTVLFMLLADGAPLPLLVILAALALIEEVKGRWDFYASRKETLV